MLQRRPYRLDFDPSQTGRFTTRPLIADQFKQLEHSLSLLSESSLLKEFERAYEVCRMEDRRTSEGRKHSVAGGGVEDALEVEETANGRAELSGWINRREMAARAGAARLLLR